MNASMPETGEKLERWKDIILRRPDPLALWPIGA